MILAPLYIFPAGAPNGEPSTVRFAGCFQASDQDDLIRQARAELGEGEIAMAYPATGPSLHIEANEVYA